ncbi:MAG TPA: ATP-binding protein [Solirubrobacteraceae bacterium]|nr:ATP-binding protein [Solirubrobacteraceae bacterium]
MRCLTPSPTLTLTIELGPDRVHVAVSDRGADIGPIAKRGEAGADGGFGLQLVDRMADRWWIERDPGTRVVCEFRAPLNRRHRRR